MLAALEAILDSSSTERALALVDERQVVTDRLLDLLQVAVDGNELENITAGTNPRTDPIPNTLTPETRRAVQAWIDART